MIKLNLFTVLILLWSVSFFSCKEEKKNDPAPSNKTSSKPTALNLDVKNESAKSNPSGGGNVTFGDGTSGISVEPPSEQKSNLNSTELANFQRMVGSNASSDAKIANTSFLAWFVDGIAIDGIDYTNDPIFDFFDYFAMFFFDDDIYITFYYDANIDDYDWDWGYYYIDANLDYLAFDIDSEFEEVWKITDVVPVNATETDLYMELYDPEDDVFIELLLASYEVD